MWSCSSSPRRQSPGDRDRFHRPDSLRSCHLDGEASYQSAKRLRILAEASLDHCLAAAAAAAEVRHKKL